MEQVTPKKEQLNLQRAVEQSKRDYDKNSLEEAARRSLKTASITFAPPGSEGTGASMPYENELANALRESAKESAKIEEELDAYAFAMSASMHE